MNKKLKTLILMSALFYAFSVSAANARQVEFKQLDIKTVLVSPPEFKAGGVKLAGNAVQPQNKWLMIMIQFVPDVKLPDGIRDMSRAAQHLLFWADDVTVSTNILLESASSGRGGGYCLFTGSTKFWHVHLNNKRHVVYMFLPGSQIDRHHVPAARSSVKRGRRTERGAGTVNSDSLVNRAKENDFQIEVIFSVGGQEITRGYCNVSGSVKRQSVTFRQLMSQVPQGRVYDGAVLSKGQSPWAFYNVNHSDPEKSVVPVK